MAEPRPLTIVFVSHTDAFGTFRVGSHHLAREFARLGHRVLHISTPVSLVHRVLRRGEASREEASRLGVIVDADGVSHLVPRTVLPAGAGGLPFARIFERVFGERCVDLVLVDQPTLWTSGLRHLVRTMVYRPTDLYEDGAKARFQRNALRTADAVVATSTAVLDALPIPTGVPSMSLPNGVELDRFAHADVAPRNDRAVYVGALDDRFDWDAVRSMAASAPAWSFDVYGPGRPPAEPLPRNVALRGTISYDDVPAVLRSARIGVLPLSNAPVNRGRSPMKLYEYLASGLTVVTRETEVLLDRPQLGVFGYGNTRDAGEAMAAAVSADSPNRPGMVAADEEGWPGKARRLLDFALEGRR
ncbi:glycosyltransferase [Plantibacter sp. CFBP 8798]|uniref:glycosyltransferase n=1 Tax=Plantibacter sp. CFBP 8798 TaxID=2775268 RepID=UPI00177BBE30|nr:glycosyltransferase [Plantibacter sp. CFBP 8798]MBD8467491.1 glycosyltransferase [Plantibacter sp. CFBP 8798]